MTKAKSLVLILAKYCIGIVLLYLVFNRSQGFDFSVVEPVLRPRFIVLIVFCKLLSFTTIVVRWRLILRALHLHIPFKKCYTLSMVGLATSYLMPGAISGDIIKTVFLQKHVKNLKMVSVSVIIDRIGGLGSIALVLVLSGVYLWFTQAEAVERVLAMMDGGRWLWLSLVLLAVVAAVGLLLWRKRDLRLKIVESLGEFKNLHAQAVPVVLLSILSQCILIYSYLVVFNEMSPEPVGVAVMSFVFAFSSLAVVLPITPGGLGMGQMAFNFVLAFFVPQVPAIGAALFTIFQVFDLVLVVPGLVLFFLEMGLKPPRS